MTITKSLNRVLDRAAAIYNSSDRTLGDKVDELHSIVAGLVEAVQTLDARLDS